MRYQATKRRLSQRRLSQAVSRLEGFLQDCEVGGRPQLVRVACVSCFGLAGS